MLLCFKVAGCILQCFDFEICWSSQGAIGLELVNTKMLFNASPTKVVPYIGKRGIDGFCIFEEKWWIFKRSKPF